MKTGIKIFGFVIFTLAFYTYVGLSVPQTITYPPETTHLSSDLTPEELVTAGEEIVAGKGTCLSCHTIGTPGEMLRFPDLGGIGAIAASRVDGLTEVEYLAQSLYEPDVYVVEGFLPGMPAINRPPISLSDQEIIAVIAYMQSLGAEPSVTLDTQLKYRTDQTSPGAVTSFSGDPVSGLDGPGIFTTFMCNTCHAIDSPTRLAGPSLHDAGLRLTPAEIYEAIMEPDAALAEGFPGVVMATTLDAIGFYQKVSSEELRSLVDYIAAQTGE